MVGEVTAVTTGPGGFIAAAQGWSTDTPDGDAVVLRSADGRSWSLEKSRGLEGPGPTRVVAAVGTDGGRQIAVVERRRAALMAPSVFGVEPLAQSGGGSWQETGMLDSQDVTPAVARALVLWGGSVLALGGATTTGDDGFVWLTDRGDVRPVAVFTGTGTVTAACTRGGRVLAVVRGHGQSLLVDLTAALRQLRIPPRS
jgi:hypothetical protein